MPKKIKTYICASCNEEFEYEDGWDENDALNESIELYGEECKKHQEEFSTVCDDCYKSINKHSLFL